MLGDRSAKTGKNKSVQGGGVLTLKAKDSGSSWDVLLCGWK